LVGFVHLVDSKVMHHRAVPNVRATKAQSGEMKAFVLVIKNIH